MADRLEVVSSIDEILGTVADLIIIGGAGITAATFFRRRRIVKPKVTVAHPDPGPPEIGNMLGIWWRFKNESEAPCETFSLGVVVKPGDYGAPLVSDVTLKRGTDILVGYSLYENDGRGPPRYRGATRILPYIEGPQKSLVQDAPELKLAWNQTYTFEFRYHWEASGPQSARYEVETGPAEAPMPNDLYR